MPDIPNTDRGDVVYFGRTAGSSPYHRRLLGFHVKEFLRHIWIKGQSGSAKTAFMSSFVAELIRMAALKMNLTVIVADHKNEPSSLANAMNTSAELGLPFKLINTKPGFATHAFNPLMQKALAHYPPLYRAELLIEGLGLAHDPTVYGAGFFRSRNEDASRELKERSDPRSFAEAVDVLDALVAARVVKRDEISHFQSSLKKVARLPLFNHTDAATLEHQVDVVDLLYRPQVLYVLAPAKPLVELNLSLSRFLLGLLQLACADHPAGTRNAVIFACDEAAAVASPQLAQVLNQARSQHLGMVIAHQDRSQLKIGAQDYTDTIASGCNIHLDFTPHRHPDEYEVYGRTTVDFLPNMSQSLSSSVSRGPTGQTVTDGISMTEGLTGRERTLFDRNARLDVAAEECCYIITVQQDTAPFGLGGMQMRGMFPYHISYEQYCENESMKPPRSQSALCEPGMTVNPTTWVAPSPIQTSPSSPTPLTHPNNPPPPVRPTVNVSSPSSDDLWPGVCEKASAWLSEVCN